MLKKIRGEKNLNLSLYSDPHQKMIYSGLKPIPYRFQLFLCNPADKPTNKPDQFSKNIIHSEVLTVEMFPIKSEWKWINNPH